MVVVAGRRTPGREIDDMDAVHAEAGAHDVAVTPESWGDCFGSYGTGAFSDDKSTSFAYSGPFALTQVVTLNLGSGSVGSFDFHSVASVPEPASVALVGCGMLTAVMALRRRTRKNAR